ncbi:protein ylxX/ylxW [Bifidobacterium pseudolongum subsp. globosum]|nr:protein ylxX/ylxW [Bifidobacterium pseudolongum subsp. globosum]
MRRRAVFSVGFANLPSHHAQAPDEVSHAPRRRRTGADSLQLIDDLINRPVDQLYSDARLVNKPDSKIVYWGTRIVVFLICIAVGFAGCQFVRLLNTAPRKQVRESLASELTAENAHLESLESENMDLRKQIEAQSAAATQSAAERIVKENEAAAGATSVEGEGIVMTIANPLAARNDDAGSLPREATADRLRIVTDTDLQLLVSLMWQHGAEAIAVNDNRLGVQTSIRTAGNSILIGTTAIESPYKIQAIGDKNALADAMSERSLPALYSDFNRSGMHPQISKTDSMRLEAAPIGKLTYAQKEE